MNLFDVFVLKLTTFFSALWLYKLFPKFFGQFNTWFYFGVTLIGSLFLIYRINTVAKKSEKRALQEEVGWKKGKKQEEEDDDEVM